MMLKKAVNNQVQDHQKGKDTTEVTHDVGKVHLTMMLKNAEKIKIKIIRKKNVQEKTLTIWEKSFDYHGDKCHKKSRSRSPVRKRYKRSWSQSVKVHLTILVKNAINDEDQDHQKGKDTTEIHHDLCKAHLSILVKNAVKSQDQDHQKGKDTREVSHDLCKVLLTIMMKNTINSIKAVHNLQRKVLMTTVGLKYHHRWQ